MSAKDAFPQFDPIGRVFEIITSSEHRNASKIDEVRGVIEKYHPDWSKPNPRLEHEKTLGVLVWAASYGADEIAILIGEDIRKKKNEDLKVREKLLADGIHYAAKDSPLRQKLTAIKEELTSTLPRLTGPVSKATDIPSYTTVNKIFETITNTEPDQQRSIVPIIQRLLLEGPDLSEKVEGTSLAAWAAYCGQNRIALLLGNHLLQDQDIPVFERLTLIEECIANATSSESRQWLREKFAVQTKELRASQSTAKQNDTAPAMPPPSGPAQA